MLEFSHPSYAGDFGKTEFDGDFDGWQIFWDFSYLFFKFSSLLLSYLPIIFSFTHFVSLILNFLSFSEIAWNFFSQSWPFQSFLSHLNKQKFKLIEKHLKKRAWPNKLQENLPFNSNKNQLFQISSHNLSSLSIISSYSKILNFISLFDFSFALFRIFSCTFFF